MSRQDKLNKGQVLLDDLNNYRPLDKPMVETTTKKAQPLIKTLLSEGHVDKTTAKWLSLTPYPPRILVFYTLTKIHKPTPVRRPIISGCSGPTERISAFVDHLIQPIAQLQASYLKDTTDFINFIERIKLPKNAMHVSMDVTIPKKPQREGITTVCLAYEEFHQGNPDLGSCLLWVMSTKISVDIARGRYSGRHSVDSRSTLGRQSVDTRSTLGRYLVDTRWTLGRYSGR